MFSRLKELNLSSTFLNLETELRVFLTIPVSNCSGEKSISFIKCIKSKSRSTMDKDRLSSLALLRKESDITDKLTIKDVIIIFVEIKK